MSNATAADPRLKRIDTSKLWPPFLADILKLLDVTTRYHAISGFRSVEEQNGLYAQGRTKPGKIVTKAPGGKSEHNFAIAIDFAWDTDPVAAGLQPGWDEASYEDLAKKAKTIPGLEAGFYWQFKDPGHIDVDLTRLGLDLAKLLAAEQHGGMPAVFALLDQALAKVSA